MEFQHVYTDTGEELEELEQFHSEASTIFSGYLASHRIDINGMPAYIGEEVTDQEFTDTYETALETLPFVEARVGQLAFARESLDYSRDYSFDDEFFTAGDFDTALRKRIERFQSYEDKIVDDMEAVSLQLETPVDPLDTSEASEIPDFNIDDWSFPEENLWPL